MQSRLLSRLHRARTHRCGFTLIELLTVISIIGILAAILIPVVGSAINSAKRNKTLAMLNNIVSMCNMYKQEYKYWPVFPPANPSTSAPTNMQLKQTPDFVPIMTGNLSTNQSLAPYNVHETQFASFSNDELNSQGTQVQDAYGNDDIVVIMDTPNSGSIPASAVTGITMQGGNPSDGYSNVPIQVDQTVPIHETVIVMSPGRGLTKDDAVTTWSPQ